MRYWILLFFVVCYATPAVAVDTVQEEQIVRIAGQVVKTFNGYEELANLPPALDQQLRRLAQKISAEMPISEQEFQRVFVIAEEEDRKSSLLGSTVLKNVAIGVIVTLLLFIVAVIGRKVQEARSGEKIDDASQNASYMVVNQALRSAPQVLFVPISSKDAQRIGHQLIESRLAARVDILDSVMLDQDTEDQVLVIKTVKGRLKRLTKFLKAASVPKASFLFPVLSGHTSYVDWIADSADGRS